MKKKPGTWSRSRLRMMKAMEPLVMSCSEATHLISDSMDTKLAFQRKVRIRLHLLLCTWCRRFARQLDLMRTLIAKGDTADDGDMLSEEARESIKKAMRSKLS